MSEPVPTDPAVAVVGAFMTALATAFDPNTVPPPLGGGNTTVRFFAGEGPAMAAWDAHAAGVGCDKPFLWVRVAQRYRSESFPEMTVDTTGCGLPEVLTVEVGAGRCAVIDQQPTWAAYDAEAQISLDDSWRIKCALAAAKALLADYTVGTEAVTPYGPEGGVIAWTAQAFIQIN